MLLHLRRSAIITVIFFAVLGLLYPLAETAIGQLAFSHQANGSLTRYGSTLVGQKWSGPKWFHGRPDGYNPMSTGGTNLGPRSHTLETDVAKQVATLEKDGIAPTSGLVTTSGSGVDPDISPAAAYAQVDAVATARGLPTSQIRQLVTSHISGAQFGFLGSPYVNVLLLNEALSALK
ncbi:MAG: potassium-transporting ATPase subunit C [Actinomycetota bacterium]|nr:MAG: potassium-transporting ATPase subunit C [Actinomycetota bacterium]